MTTAGLSAQYEQMWRVSFIGSTVEGDVEAMQVNNATPPCNVTCLVDFRIVDDLRISYS